MPPRARDVLFGSSRVKRLSPARAPTAALFSPPSSRLFGRRGLETVLSSDRHRALRGVVVQGCVFSAIHVFGLVVLPGLLEVLGVFARTRLDAHQDAALLDPLFVALDALFGNAPADQCAHQPAGGGTGAGA